MPVPSVLCATMKLLSWRCMTCHGGYNFMSGYLILITLHNYFQIPIPFIAISHVVWKEKRKFRGTERKENSTNMMFKKMTKSWRKISCILMECAPYDK